MMSLSDVKNVFTSVNNTTTLTETDLRKVSLNQQMNIIGIPTFRSGKMKNVGLCLRRYNGTACSNRGHLSVFSEHYVSHIRSYSYNTKSKISTIDA